MVLLFLSAFAMAQARSATPAKPVTVPITLDHNRIVIDVFLPLPDGSTKRVRGWVDNGNPDLEMSQRVAKLLGLNITCDEKACTAPPPREITIGDMKVPLTSVKQAKIPKKSESAESVVFPGMSAEINIPSLVLRNYDVMVDFPEREFTLGSPGTLAFKGLSAKVLVNSENGLIQVPSQIENKKYNLALDMGSSFSFLALDLSEKLLAAHAGWPHMIGAVGSANMWGLVDEPKWKLLRVERLHYGPVYLTDVAFAEFSSEAMDWFAKRAGMATVGLLGSNALLNYRVGIDYAHSTAHFEIGSTFKAPDFDLVGLTLRPEDDGRYTIIGVPDFGGKPAVPEVQVGDHLIAVDSTPVPESTMGQVWSLLEGQPGQERKLRVERAGRQFEVAGQVRNFLAQVPEENIGKKKK